MGGGGLECERCAGRSSHLILVGAAGFVCGRCRDFLGRFRWAALARREVVSACCRRVNKKEVY